MSNRGDLWLLGSHRLLCGDSTQTADVENLLAGSPADMAFADPPYNVNYSQPSITPGRVGRRSPMTTLGRDSKRFWRWLAETF